MGECELGLQGGAWGCGRQQLTRRASVSIDCYHYIKRCNCLWTKRPFPYDPNSPGTFYCHREGEGRAEGRLDGRTWDGSLSNELDRGDTLSVGDCLTEGSCGKHYSCFVYILLLSKATGVCLCVVEGGSCGWFSKFQGRWKVSLKVAQ